MNDGYIGEIRIFAGNFAPVNWAFCSGQTLAIAENNALYSIVGTMYGGNGTSTFALPDLRGRAPIGVGTGPGLSNITQGQKGGVEKVTLNSGNMPAHVHNLTSANAPISIHCESEDAVSDNPSGKYPGFGDSKNIYSASPDATMNAGMATISGQTDPAGSSTPTAINSRNPFLGIQYIICTNGIYPSRS